jgi:hypothetical protein
MDWWCLGLLMHEMISSRHPFHGATHYDTLKNMVTKPPTIDPRLSPTSSAIVRHFLVKVSIVCYSLCMSLCMYVCIYVCMYGCMVVWLYVCMYVYS